MFSTSIHGSVCVYGWEELYLEPWKQNYVSKLHFKGALPEATKILLSLIFGPLSKFIKGNENIIKHIKNIRLSSIRMKIRNVDKVGWHFWDILYSIWTLLLWAYIYYEVSKCWIGGTTLDSFLQGCLSRWCRGRRLLRHDNPTSLIRYWLLISRVIHDVLSNVNVLRTCCWPERTRMWRSLRVGNAMPALGVHDI